MMSPNKGRRALFAILTLIGSLAIIEVVFFVAGRILQNKWGMWKAPATPTGSEQSIGYAEYMKRRDPVLGWPFPSEYGAMLDVNGAQRNPYFPRGPEEGSCVSLYGDSFTFGGDTSSLSKNWGNVLSAMMGCYVANYGVGGYGTDQAYLRFVKNREDPSLVVIFGLHPGDTLRNLTRIRDLESCQKSYALKPRFVIDDDRRLKLVPIPILTEEEYLRILTLRGKPLTLEHETLYPGGPAGVVKLRFPYSVSVVRNMLIFYGFRSQLFGRPEYMEFLEKGHPLHGLDITIGITQEFVKLATARRKVPIVLILPHAQDLAYYFKTNRMPYHNLVEAYRREKIPFYDFGQYLAGIAKTSGRRVEEYFGETGHYNDEGNALVAEFVYNHLKHKKLVGAAARAVAEDQSFPRSEAGHASHGKQRNRRQ
jgi:hypothetical protein